MRIILFFLAFIGAAGVTHAQKVHLGLFGGASAYSGELSEKIFPKKATHGVIGITGNYEIADHFMLRAGVNYAVLSGADRNNTDTFSLHRNLSFKTKLLEFNLTGEFYLFNFSERRYSPYAFAGLAIYHYNPYAVHPNGVKTYLKPLSTEGQGIAGYSNRQPYSLTQFAIPFGLGIKYSINDNLRIGVEVGLRKLFTDYIDDVSTNYIDPNDLLVARGQTAVDMSYRGDEVPGGNPLYPAKGAQRGGSTNMDYYYFGGIHLTQRLGGENSGGGGGGGSRGRHSRMGCPVNIY